MSFRTKLLARVDRIRRIPMQKFDMRQHDIFMVLQRWSGGVVGEGSKTILKTQLFVGGNSNIRVREVSSKDVVASGGLLTESSVKVGPFTPSYPGGGLDNPQFDPPVSNKPQEVFFYITGLGMGPTGRWFKRTNDHSIQNYTTWLYLASTGEQA